MALNVFMEFLFWFLGVVQFIGVVGGLLAWAVLLWLTCSERGRHVLCELRLYDEFRCPGCTIYEDCEAADTGVCYPCSGYEMKEDRP